MIGALLAIAIEVADVPKRAWEPPRCSAQHVPRVPEHEKPATVRVVPAHLSRGEYRIAIRKLRRMQNTRKT